jgi:hypothetical protein
MLGRIVESKMLQLGHTKFFDVGDSSFSVQVITCLTR